MKPSHITVHCSATQNTATVTAERIREWHLEKGWSDIGYHFVIESNGKLKYGRTVDVNGAHVKGHNQNNIGICLVGGVDAMGNPSFNFDPLQMEQLRTVIKTLCWAFNIPRANVKGHRDWSPDLNKDGVISEHEWLKYCPCFEVSSLEIDEVA